MSSVAAPLNKLLQKREKWRWTATEEQSFDELKRRLASAPVLAHYDGRRPVRLITDASPHGVGAVLMQVGEDGAERPVRFASRSLTKAEKAYSQFDREGLAVIFGVARYKQYLVGTKVYAGHGQQGTDLSLWAKIKHTSSGNSTAASIGIDTGSIQL